MSPERFNHLLILVGPLIAKKPCRSRNTFTEAERLMVTLRYLATGEAQETQAFCFRLGKATVSRIVRETCKALGEALNETYVKTLSTSDDWKNIAQAFDEEIYVIHRPGGPYWEKLCPRSRVRPEAAGRGPYSRQRAQFFPIRTDQGR